MRNKIWVLNTLLIADSYQPEQLDPCGSLLKGGKDKHTATT